MGKADSCIARRLTRQIGSGGALTNIRTQAAGRSLQTIAPTASFLFSEYRLRAKGIRRVIAPS